ncbi:hypothetical protein [Actinocorallia sp. A-T 12471]|uniref:hypothetical protein n=1 Tax=Actinocorallia sp. A-T 12471 TaxID=3089813 RepID=UPI0029CB4B91|nr:hypothetical protein [Actinocorallia sp. A-T 12471]MDX6740338.1 hypothetical protein [Actinocorallia sp. A-T 12471]
MDYEETALRCRRMIADGPGYAAFPVTPGPGPQPVYRAVVDDAAAVEFVEISSDLDSHSVETFVFQRVGDTWVLLGGDACRDAGLPQRVPAAEQGGEHLAVCRTTLVRKRRAPLLGARHIVLAEVHASLETHAVTADGVPLPLAAHGCVPVLWTGRRPPLIEARDASGALLASLRPAPPR